MRAEELIHKMDAPITNEPNILSDLNDLVEEFPYFPAARVLFTQYLKVGKDSRFNAELRKTACYTGDRKKLFYLIESESFPAEKIALLEKEIETALPFDWIDDFLEKTSQQPPKNKEAVELPSPVSIDYLRIKTEQPEKPINETVTLKGQEAIDKFIKDDEQGKIKIYLPSEEEKAENTSKPLLEDDKPLPLTMTLAKIYVRQKKYDKAKEIIKALYLQNPEKNIYFADQIRFFEKLINNTKK